MDDIKLKIRQIYVPYIIVAVLTIVIYNFLRWVLDIKIDLIPFKKDILVFWIPFIIPWISVLIWLRRRIKLLKVNGNWGNGYFLYQSIMVASIVIPLINSVNYIDKVSYDLIELESVSEIINYKEEKYFRVKDFNFSKESCLYYVTSQTFGKNNDKLGHQLYLSCPVKQSKVIWYGIEYKKNTSNWGSSKIKNYEFQDFLFESEVQFNNSDYRKINYLEKLRHSNQRNGYLEAITSKIGGIEEDEQIILIPHKEKFSNRYEDSILWIFGSFGVGSLLLFGMILIPKIDQKELNNFLEKN